MAAGASKHIVMIATKHPIAEPTLRSIVFSIPIRHALFTTPTQGYPVWVDIYSISLSSA
jgi:hypothetical protein